MAKSFNELRDKMSPERREQNQKRAQLILARMDLQDIRKARELTQQELANILDVKQAALSKMENQSDIRVSTLRKLLAAMGANLKIVAEFPEGEIIIDQFETF